MAVHGLGVTLSDPTDCHGPPSRIAILEGAPFALEAVDASGTRTTSIDGAEVRTFLLFADGSRRATNVAKLSTRGVWHFDHAEDPLGIALDSGVAEVLLVANLTHYLPLPEGSNHTCCTLSVPRANRAGETLVSLFMPPLRIARLFARNTGRQGGYGVGDSIEITFARRTDRASFGVGEVLSRKTVDEMLVLRDDLGPDPQAYAGAWRDDCTLMLVAGNTTAATTPVTGVFTVRVRDDIHELRDARRFLHLASVVTSPTLEGTFGAQTGFAGRTDPLRAMLPDLAVRRYVPPPENTLESLRIGPLSWHPTTAYDVERDRTSECDPAYAQPDGLVGPRRPGSLPPYALDDATENLIRSVVDHMAREVPHALPVTDPPRGLPDDPLHSHAAGHDAPPPPPWVPAMARQQQDERAAAAAIGPNGQVQRYPLTLDAVEHARAFGLERRR